MADLLRDRCRPRDLAVRRQVIEISEKIGSFEQLAALMDADLSALDPGKIAANSRDSLVTGTLNFSFADENDGAVALDIELAASLMTVCQRCLQPFELPLSAQHRLLLSGPDNSAEEREGYEIWEHEGEGVSAIEIAEEVLVMAIPLSAMHPQLKDCVADRATEFEEETITPFASLRAQMENKT